MKKAVIALIGVCLLIPISSNSQTMSKKELKESVRQYRIEHEHEIFKELVDFLSIPNNADDLPNIRRNAELIKSMMEKRGISSQVMEAATGEEALSLEGLTPEEVEVRRDHLKAMGYVN